MSDPLDVLGEPPPKRAYVRRSPLKKRKKKKPEPEPKDPTVKVIDARKHDPLDRLARPPPTSVIMFQPADLPAEISGKMGLYSARHVHKEMILTLTGNGLELILHALAVLRGQATRTEIDNNGDQVEVRPTWKDQEAARRWLSEYSMSVMKQQVDVNVRADGAAEPPPDLSALSTEELQQYLTLKRKLRSGKALSAGPIIDVTPEPAP